MTPIEVVEFFRKESETSKGNIIIEEPLSQEEIRGWAACIPTKQLPYVIEEILDLTDEVCVFSTGMLEFGNIWVSDNYEQFPFRYAWHLNSGSAQGFGSAFVDIHPETNELGGVYIYYSKVMYKVANNIDRYLDMFVEAYKSNVDFFDVLIMNVEKLSFADEIKQADAMRMSDITLASFAEQQESDFMIYDLRDSKELDAIDFSNINDPQFVKHKTEPIWAIRTRPPKKNFLQRLFNFK